VKHATCRVFEKDADSYTLWNMYVLCNIVVESFFSANSSCMKGHMVVEIEIYITRGPLEIPAHPLLVRHQFLLYEEAESYRRNPEDKDRKKHLLEY
jgi:hypothetical protein